MPGHDGINAAQTGHDSQSGARLHAFFSRACSGPSRGPGFFLPGFARNATSFWKDWQTGKSTFYIFAGLILYVLLLKPLGFYIDTFLLMFFLMRLSGERGYKRPLSVSLFTVVITYVVFYKLLYIPFPKGLLGI